MSNCCMAAPGRRRVRDTQFRGSSTCSAVFRRTSETGSDTKSARHRESQKDRHLKNTAQNARNVRNSEGDAKIPRCWKVMCPAILSKATRMELKSFEIIETSITLSHRNTRDLDPTSKVPTAHETGHELLLKQVVP